MFINWKAVKEKHILRLAVDVFMLNVAIINILLISFDYTYFIFRDFYFHNFPSIVSLYDPMKGVEPHRVTETYIERAENYLSAFAAQGEAPQLREEMVDLSVHLIDDDPFKIASNSGDLELIKQRVREFMGISDSSKDAFRRFWQLTPQNFEQRRDFFNTQIKPVLQTNYWRGINTAGRYIDYFIYIDLIFIIIFLAEFLIMYIRAIKRHGPDQRVLYPIYHWYDLVSCIPLQQLRYLRLLRFVSVYIRLRNSDIIVVGDGPVSRQIRKYKNMIAEELSDRVSYQILDDIQKELELGINRDILKKVLIPYKYNIREVIVKNIKRIESRALTQKHNEWVDFVSELVDDSVKYSEEYRKVVKLPIIGDRVRAFLTKEKITELVDKSIQNFSTNLDKSLDSEAGMAFITSLVDDIIDEFLLILDDELVLSLMAQINIQIVKELKKGLEVKTWKLEKEQLKLISGDFT